MTMLRRPLTTAAVVHPRLDAVCRGALEAMRTAGTLKAERVLVSAQGTEVTVRGRARPLVNLASNNYLGLANDPRLVAAAHRALDSHGVGLASVRFICGTQDLHKRLEARIAAFHGTDDAVLYPSCFDANAAFFEAVLTAEDAVVSDALNHASLIDGIRLCKARRLRYAHRDVGDLRAKLGEAADARLVVVVTDGAFSMDGDLAPLEAIRAAADDAGNAIVLVDECHATGVLGQTGRGTPELFGTRVDVLNSTLGKALGGATGGYTAGPQPLVDLLRNKARTYLFSNSMPPATVAAALAAFDILGHYGDSSSQESPLTRLRRHTHRFRDGLQALGFDSSVTVLGHRDHPIVPIRFGDAALTARIADALLEEGLFVVGFSYPVVPKGEARIRCQLSAAHTEAQIDAALAAFETIGRAFGLCPPRA